MPHDLGLEITSFDNIGMSAATFLSEIAQEEYQEQEVSNEEYQTDRYEQERFTDDARSAYFEDDENKAERFTDDYREGFTDQLIDIYLYNI